MEALPVLTKVLLALVFCPLSFLGSRLTNCNAESWDFFWRPGCGCAVQEQTRACTLWVCSSQFPGQQLPAVITGRLWDSLTSNYTPYPPWKRADSQSREDLDWAQSVLPKVPEGVEGMEEHWGNGRTV